MDLGFESRRLRTLCRHNVPQARRNPGGGPRGSQRGATKATPSPSSALAEQGPPAASVALRDQDPLHDQAAALEVDEPEELTGHTAHRPPMIAFSSTWVVELKLLDVAQSI